MNPWDQFTGVNAGYVFELYERYQRDPASVDEATRAAFAHWSPEIEAEPRRGRRRGARDGPDGGDRRRSTWPSRSAASAISRRASIRSASPIRSAIRRSLPQSHGLTTDTLARLPASIVAGPAAERRRPTRSRRSSGCARSTAPRPATTTTTCSCPRSACGCARRSRPASSGRRTIRSTRASCSIASRRSRSSSASCTAPSRARRASRSKAST